MTASSVNAASGVDAVHVPASHDIAYRPDIDGLRAIAVASVVVFHAGVSSICGGFVGVDIFFVISGYLIGGQIFRDLDRGKFSFSIFYSKRFRRILPALFALLLVFLAVGLVILTPVELREVGKGAFATIFGLSNVLFYTAGGYFAPAADLNPLLMTWSLGIEEQFYVLFPFVAILLAKTKLSRPATLSILSMVAFVASIAMLTLDPKAAFYLLPTRSWELAIGVVLAVLEGRSRFGTLPRWVIEIAAVVAVLALAASLLLYKPEYKFPGLFVLLPTLGAVLLISTRTSIVNRVLLSVPIMTFLGRVSYSWYLWHWPVFFLLRMLEIEFAGWMTLVPILGSLAFAVLSWRFIEQPFRLRVLPVRTVLIRYGVAAVVLSIPMAALYASNGLPQRLSAETRSMAEQASAARADRCLAPFGARDISPQACASAGSGNRLLIIGDSHASAISPGFNQIALQNGLAFGELTKSSCVPLAGYARDLPDRAGHWADCIAYQNAVFSYIEARPEISTVVLAGFWSENPVVRSAAGVDMPFEAALLATVDRLRAIGRVVVLVKDVPLLSFDPYARVIGGGFPVRAALVRQFGDTHSDGSVAGFDAVKPDTATAVIERVAVARPDVIVVDPKRSLCDEQGCRYRRDGMLYYFDFQHLTAAGAVEATKGVDLPVS